MKRAVAIAAAAAGSLVLAPIGVRARDLSPPVAKAKVLQQFTLAVPTEEGSATTTQVELTCPTGFDDRLVRAVAGLEALRAATGSARSR
jgi:uncharacterized protein YcnI